MVFGVKKGLFTQNRAQHSARNNSGIHKLQQTKSTFSSHFFQKREDFYQKNIKNNIISSRTPSVTHCLSHLLYFQNSHYFHKELSTLQQYIYFTLKKDSKSCLLHTKSMFFFVFNNSTIIFASAIKKHLCTQACIISSTYSSCSSSGDERRGYVYYYIYYTGLSR